jgi:sec-independent protein translocase protein TatA
MLESSHLVKTMAFLPNLGPFEIMLILLGVLILFGAPKLPEFARSMGKSLRIFKEEANNLRREFENSEPPSASAAKETKSETPQKAIDVEGKVEAKKS